MNIEEQVLSIVRENIEKGRVVTLASDLRKELCLDSFGTLMVINGLEDGFGVTVDQADFCRIKTVGDVVGLLQTKYLAH
jgi:acyl carrier protein